MNNNFLISIRKFSLKDLNRIMEIECNSFTTETFSENRFLSLYHRCSDLFIVAEICEIITGYMVTRNYWKKGRIISIAVDLVYRCKGIGSALVNYTFNQLKNFHIKIAELIVFKDDFDILANENHKFKVKYNSQS